MSVILGYSSSRSPVSASPILVDCQQYTCKVIHLYWKGEKDRAWAIENSNGGAETDGRKDIWTDKSDVKNPSVEGTETWVDQTYGSCTPLCNKDANGVWLSPQELTAVSSKSTYSETMIKLKCKDSGGELTKPQKNWNATDKNVPPGVK